MYEYVSVYNPKLTTKSLFTRRGNQTINIRLVKGKIEVSLAIKGGYSPAFDIKLVDDRLWSRYGLTLLEHQKYEKLLTHVREIFPRIYQDWGDWEERIRN